MVAALGIVATGVGVAAGWRVRAAVRRYESLDADTAAVPGARLYLRGRRIHLRLEGAGQPVLLLHGLGASGLAFRRIAPLLADRYALVIPDLPGAGYSERDPLADLSQAATARLMLDLMDRLEIGRFAIIGHSLGAALAVRIAAMQPERIPALVLVGGPGITDVTLPPWSRPLLRLILPVLVQNRRVVTWLIRAASAPGTGVDAATVESALESARVRDHLATMLALLTAPHDSLRPAALPMPTLLLAGAHDGYMPPRRVRGIARQMPRGRGAVIPGAGHLVLEEQPHAAVRHILPLLARANLPGAQLSPIPQSPPLMKETH